MREGGGARVGVDYIFGTTGLMSRAIPRICDVSASAIQDLACDYNAYGDVVHVTSGHKRVREK